MSSLQTGPFLATKQSSYHFATASTRLSYIAPPIDTSAIPADVVVAFKNLLKKDGTTKARALEDIIAYVQKHPYDDGGPDDSILDAWVRHHDDSNLHPSSDYPLRTRACSSTLIRPSIM